MAYDQKLAQAELSIDGLKLALRRAAGAIQGNYVGAGHKGINGEAITALATCIQVPGQSWQDAVAAAKKQLEADWPNSI